MKLKYKFAIEKVDDDYVAVAVGEDAKNYRNLVKLNETSKRIFELLFNDISEKEIIDALKEEYEEAEAEQIEKSVAKQIEYLKMNNLLKE